MKFKSLFFAAIAAVFSFASCEEMDGSQDLGNPAITISDSEMTFATAGETKTLTLVATRDWKVENVPAWLTVTPAQGKGSLDEQTITLTAAANTEYSVDGKLTFTIMMDSKTLTVSQEGPKGTLQKGTAENPYLASEALALAKGLTAEEQVENAYVKGVITAITSVDTGSYGNAEYTIADKAGDVNTFLVFRGYYLDTNNDGKGDKFTSANQIKVGDEVVVKGTIVNYGGTKPEFTSGSQIISINGSTTPDQGGDDSGDDEPAVPTEPVTVSIADFLAAAEGTQQYIVTGTIVAMDGIDPQYNNVSLTISDGTKDLYVFRMKHEANTDLNTLGLNINDIITVKGVRTSYNDAPQMGTPFYISHEDKEAPAAVEGAIELSFADKANRTEFSTSKQVWKQNGITLTNDKSSSTSNVGDYANPARFYKSSKITVALEEGKTMTKIDFVCNNATYAAELKNSITDTSVTVALNATTVSVTFAQPVNSFVIAATAAQVRVNSLTVYTK